MTEEAGPLGPDSLTWRYFGDWRNLLVVLWAGSMQNMHPGLGIAVEEHSAFFGERWQRIFRSFYPIIGVVYDGLDAKTTARKVRGYHDTIQGTKPDDSRYHALAPDTYYWAHAVFFMTTIRFADRFMGGVTEADRRQLFKEHVQWYRLYGMTMRPVPPTWEDFQAYWDHTCAEVLEDNKATRDVLDLGDIAKPHFLPWLPTTLWRKLWRIISGWFVWLTVGLYDPVVRDRLGYRWTERDERWHRRLGRLVHRAFLVLPHDRRFHPRARAGWRRARGRTTGLIESPRRNRSTAERQTQ